MKKIAIATTGRADWGLLSPLASALRDTGQAEVVILAGNMHFDPALGLTYKEIESDGFEIAARIAPADDAISTAADSLAGFGSALSRIHPECIILLGDRYETLAIATAAAILRIPIVHIAGGTVSEGAFDDSFRHAITKLSTLHLAETEEHRKRIIQMGENPRHVVTTGAIGLHIFRDAAHNLMSLSQLRESIQFPIDNKTLIATLHPATLDPAPPEQQMLAFLSALDSVPDRKVIITYPNNDTDPAPLISLIENYAAQHPQRVIAIPSLGRKRYISALCHAEAVVGNSSSGIVEVPSAGIPTLDIGIRQKGRTAAPSVIHCGPSESEIVDGLQKVLSPHTKAIAAKRVNPYSRPDTLALMTQTILSFPFSTIGTKHFFDL